MTTKAKAAIEWLEQWVDDPLMSDADKEHARTLKAMLARPVIPDELSDEFVEHIWWAARPSHTSHRELAWEVLNTIRVYLTAPKTKEVEVWHVAYVLTGAHPAPCAVNVYRTRQCADAVAAKMTDQRAYACVHVTGPHKQQVPA